MTELIAPPLAPKKSAEFSPNALQVHITNGRHISIRDPITSNEPITVCSERIARLLQSKALLRLTGVSVNGPTAYVGAPRLTTTRYAHSVGTMAFLLHAGVKHEDELIAALLHDLPHTALSHVSDTVAAIRGNFATPHERRAVAAASFHETEKERLLSRFDAELSSILGSDWRVYLAAEHWPLTKDNQRLAADIADYLRRDAVAGGLRTPAQARALASGCECHRGRLAVDSREFSDLWEALSADVGRHFYESAWNAAANYAMALGVIAAVDAGKFTWADFETAAVPEPAIAAHARECNAGGFAELASCEWRWFGTASGAAACGFDAVREVSVRLRRVTPTVAGQAPASRLSARTVTQTLGRRRL
jgi:hypothetical protein